MSYSFFSIRLLLPQKLILDPVAHFPEKLNVEALNTIYKNEGLEFDEYGNPSVIDEVPETIIPQYYSY